MCDRFVFSFFLSKVKVYALSDFPELETFCPPCTFRPEDKLICTCRSAQQEMKTLLPAIYAFRSCPRPGKGAAQWRLTDMMWLAMWPEKCSRLDCNKTSFILWSWIQTIESYGSCLKVFLFTPGTLFNAFYSLNRFYFIKLPQPRKVNFVLFMALTVNLC